MQTRHRIGSVIAIRNTIGVLVQIVLIGFVCLGLYRVTQWGRFVDWAGLGLACTSFVGGYLVLRRWFARVSGKREVLRAALVVVAVGVLVAWSVRMPLAMGSGPAGPVVERAAFNTKWSDRPVVVLALGDSISTGFGADAGLGYFDLLLENHEGEHPAMRGIDLRSVYPNLTRRDFAANSTRSQQHESVIAALPVEDDAFGIVCITTGGIDLIHRYGMASPSEGAMYGATLEQARPWVRGFEQRLLRMVELLRTKFPAGCAVFLATIYDPTDGVGDIENAPTFVPLPRWPAGLGILRRYNRAIRRVAAELPHVHLVNVHRTMLGHGIHCDDESAAYYDADDPHYWYYRNLEDPNQRGHDAIRRTFLNAMVKALAPKPASVPR